MLTSAYALELAVERGVLRIRATGAYSRRRASNLILAVREQADRRGLKRVLLDTTGVPQRIPDADRSSVSAEAAGAWGDLAVAAVNPTEYADRFVETVAAERDARRRLFASEAAAIEWLVNHGPGTAAE
jgi:hypothetical protein